MSITPFASAIYRKLLSDEVLAGLFSDEAELRALCLLTPSLLSFRIGTTIRLVSKHSSCRPLRAVRSSVYAANPSRYQ